MYRINAVLLVGGQGTRLRSIIGAYPKPLAKFGSLNILDLILKYLDSVEAIDKVILATGFMKEEFLNYKYEKYHFSLEFSSESQPLGTAGAVYNAIVKVNSDYILIINGDTFCQFTLPHKLNLEDDGYIFVRKSSDEERYGYITTCPDKKYLLKFNEKVCGNSNFINAGVYLFKRDLINDYGRLNQSMETEFIPKLLQVGKKIQVVECFGKFTDIGIPSSFMEAGNYLKDEINSFKNNECKNE